MPQINQVRTSVPAQQTPAWAGAMQGFGRHFSLQQEKAAANKENMMSILPALASIRALQPAMEGEEGAIDLGGGNFVKIVSPVATSQDKLADMRAKQLEYSMSPEGLAAAETAEYKDNNAIMLNGLEAKKPGSRAKAVSDFYESSLAVHMRGQGSGGATGGSVKVQIYNTDTKEIAEVSPEMAAEMKSKHPETYIDPPGQSGGLGKTLGIAATVPFIGGALYKGLPMIARNLKHLKNPYVMAGSAAMTGAGMYNDYQRDRGGRQLFEDRGAYAERTGRDPGRELFAPDPGQQQMFNLFGHQFGPQVGQGQGQVTPQQTMPIPVPR